MFTQGSLTSLISIHTVIPESPVIILPLALAKLAWYGAKGFMEFLPTRYPFTTPMWKLGDLD